METIIAAGITAIITLLITLIGIAPKLAALEKQISELEKSNNRLKESLSGEHQGLSREHQGLSAEHQALTNGLRDNQTTLTFLKEEQLKAQARQELLRAQEPDAQKALEVLQLTLSRVAELERQLQVVRAENQALREENAKLRTEHPEPHPKPSREEDWEPDFP